MSRWIALAVVPLIAVPVAFAQDDELVAAAKNPYDLARYVNSHKDIDEEILGKAVRADKPPSMPRCQMFECSADVVTLFNPEQAIVAVQSWPFDTYVRFLRNGAQWRYAGAQDVFKKNHAGRYEVSRIGEKPFLRISMQGANGSDWDSEVETWYDLTRQDFEPVFGFTVQGGENRFSGISRDVWASASPGFGPINSTGSETIEVDVAIAFSIMHERNLGSARYRATYERAQKQQKFILGDVKPIAGTTLKISNRDFELLADIDVDGGPTDEQLLVYALPGLRAVASGSNQKDREWLKSVLAQCKDTPEKRELQKLLDRKP